MYQRFQNCYLWSQWPFSLVPDYGQLVFQTRLLSTMRFMIYGTAWVFLAIDNFLPDKTKSVFKEITVRALIIGLIVGVSSGILTLAFITPLILEAELYEEAGVDGNLAGHSSSQTLSQHTTPKNLWQRNLITVAGSVFLAVCYSLVLSTVYPFFPLSNCWVRGLSLGFTGFLFLNFIPNLGLPANPPGIEYVADVVVRQRWWFFLLACESTALALSFFLLKGFQKKHLSKNGLILGILFSSGLILIPFLIGAPNKMGHSLVPEHIVVRFRQFSIILNLVTWIFLGTLVTLFLKTHCKNIPPNLIES